MVIDWFTVLAQALNFVVLVFLLKRYLYGPILNAIDAREKKVAAELEGAEAVRAEAQEERDRFRSKNEDFDQQRACLLKEATDGAQAEGGRLLEEARSAADALRTRQQEALRSDAEHLNGLLLQTTQSQVFAIARKALADLATTGLEERIAEVFARRLRELDEETKAQLAQAFVTGAEPAVVKSAFELGSEQRAVIQKALNDAFSADVRLGFRRAPELVGGIELVVQGHKVAWSIGEYLSALEARVASLVQPSDRLASGEGAA